MQSIFIKINSSKISNGMICRTIHRTTRLYLIMIMTTNKVSPNLLKIMPCTYIQIGPTSILPLYLYFNNNISITWSRPNGCMFTSLSTFLKFLVSFNYTTTAIFTAHLRKRIVITSSYFISDKSTVCVFLPICLKHCHWSTKALQ